MLLLPHSNRPNRRGRVRRCNKQDQSGLQRRKLSEDHGWLRLNLLPNWVHTNLGLGRQLGLSVPRIRHPDNDDSLVDKIRQDQDRRPRICPRKTDRDVRRHRRHNILYRDLNSQIASALATAGCPISRF